LFEIIKQNGLIENFPNTIAVVNIVQIVFAAISSNNYQIRLCQLGGQSTNIYHTVAVKNSAAPSNALLAKAGTRLVFQN